MTRKTDFACCDLCKNFEVCNDGMGRCDMCDRSRGKAVDGLPVTNVCPMTEHGMVCKQVCMPKEKRKKSAWMPETDGSVYGLPGQPQFEMKASKEWLTVFVL